MNIKKCNICGKEFDMWDKQENFELHYHVGYGSVHDGEVIELDLCCDCFDKVLEIILPMCQINPIREVE